MRGAVDKNQIYMRYSIHYLLVYVSDIAYDVAVHPDLSTD